MDRLSFDDIELTYERHDGGPRVVLVHALPFVSWYRPLIDELAGFSTLSYRRHLRRRDDGTHRPLTVAEDATTCARLMDEVGWPKAHIVGHSYGALVALEMATSVPARVRSVALLEPAARGVSSSAAIAAVLKPVIAAYRSGDAAGAVNGFLRHVCGDDYRAPLDDAVPGAFAEALDAADVFFQAELPAVQQWSFGPEQARRVTQPVLNVLGAKTAPRFAEGAELVQSWLPEAEQLVVPDVGHLLMVQNATALAAGLGDFFTRHPIDNAEQPAAVG
jgi:pimeloyl-ACP methyl ester carboxylesterase